MRNGAWKDWLGQFLAFTEGVPSPEIFRLWAGISALAGALERRVWARTARQVLYPNLFTLLVAAPGMGKTVAITPVQELWYATQKFHVAPSNVTKAAMVDALAAADRKILSGSTILEYHSMLVAASEFGVLVPSHDLEFLSVLNHIYDNPRNYSENRRSLAKNVDIIHPQLNILAGSQPGYLASLLPEEAWTMGFTSRLIMIYSAKVPNVELFADETQGNEEVFKELVSGLVALSGLFGQVVFSQEAVKFLQQWRLDGYEPVPLHSKLQHYNPRRIMHIVKLSIVSAVSRTGGLEISVLDCQRAREWLLAAETLMPDIFREMTQKSDGQVVKDLHFFAWQKWVKDKKPIHSAALKYFLHDRCPVEKVDKILEMAGMINVLVRQAGTELYIPKPVQEHGME